LTFKNVKLNHEWHIQYRVQLKAKPKKQLLDFIKSEHEGDAGIVYCMTRRKVDETALWLNAEGLRALPYHAGLSQPERAKNQHSFIQE
jgi:ATP-dependent DNA helicase RecQ